MNCSHCDIEFDENLNKQTCPGCGNTLDIEVAQATPPEKEKEPDKKQTKLVNNLTTYKDMTSKELKVECAKRKISKQGNRKVLIKRLENNDG